MKKFYILLVAMIVLLLSSCQRSQFSTTTRQNKNGKVTYVNHYPTESTKSSTVKSHKSHLKEAEAQKNLTAPDKTGVQDIPEPEIKKITPVLIFHNENLIASTSNQTTIITGNENRFVSNNEQLVSIDDHSKGIDIYEPADTINGKKSKKEKTNVPSGKCAIFFKSGNKEIVKIVSQSHDTLFYYSINKPEVTVGVMMEQIDTILWVPFGKQVIVIKFKSGKEESVNIISKSHDTIFYTLIKKPNIIQAVKTEQIDTIVKVKYYDSVKGKVVDIRKNEPLGLVGFILSILGFIPGIGIPFAILGIIWGVRSLHRIKRFPEKYKGKGFGQASLIIGILAIIFNFIFAIILLSNALSSCGSMRM